MIKSPVVSQLVLGVAVLMSGVLGLFAGVFGALRLGIALHGDHEYFLHGAPVGTALVVVGAALGASLPLAAHALWRKAGGLFADSPSAHSRN